jgi:hypothetical protein
MDGKTLIASKTFWLNVASVLLLVAALFLPGGQFAELLGPKVVEYIGIGVAVLNIVLRVFFTSEPIKSVL